MNRLVWLVAVLIIAFGASQAAAVVVYSNPYDPNSTNAYSSWNQVGGEGLYHQSFADYMWEDPFYMTDFHWWGIPYVGESQMFDGFTFQVWGHDVASGRPGSILFEEFFAGNAGQTFVETNAYLGRDVFKYGIDLTTPFRPMGAGHYWFSVIAHSADNWFWAQTSQTTWDADWQHANIPFPGAEYWDHPTEGVDFAYEITTGDPIPEPATMILVGLGLLGMAARRKLRK